MKASKENDKLFCKCGDQIIPDDEVRCGTCVMLLENDFDRARCKIKELEADRDARAKEILDAVNTECPPCYLCVFHDSDDCDPDRVLETGFNNPSYRCVYPWGWIWLALGMKYVPWYEFKKKCHRQGDKP